MDKVQFLATFPQIMTAIKVTGNGDGMRIQLDIPEAEMGNAAFLIAMRGKRLKVTIETIELSDPMCLEELLDKIND